MLDQFIEEVLLREGAKDTNDPNDAGGRTKYGISERFHPEIWAEGPPTKEEAEDIYMNQYIIGPNFHRIQPQFLFNTVADYGVHSGPSMAARTIQRLLNVEDDGIVGPKTLAVLAHRTATEDGARDLNNALVARRILNIDRIVQKRPSDLKWLYGWHSRILSFLV